MAYRVYIGFKSLVLWSMVSEHVKSRLGLVFLLRARTRVKKLKRVPTVCNTGAFIIPFAMWQFLIINIL